MRLSSDHSIIAVTCLSFEARIAGRIGVRVLCAARPRRFAEQLDAQASDGCRGIVSFGVAGGLEPGLRPGKWVVASGVVSDAGRLSTDPTWSRRLLDAFPGAVHADISGIDRPAADPTAKALLRERHRTVAADTESHIVARVATARRIPFAAVRVILDPAHRPLPPAALVPLRADGAPDVRGVAMSVRAAPGQLLGLVRITADAFCARAALHIASRRMDAVAALAQRPAIDSCTADADDMDFVVLAPAEDIVEA